MRYGFAIDQNRCIGCHACTVACKEEHHVAVGVFRTWVKYIEKGAFPQTRRHFGVLRCNHCEKAPCVAICPTRALFRRDNGIVDFDSRRCIGCKGCMQACPYDALYIDPETQTAAKCNFCAHRVEAGLEPACVIVCPTQAIIAGDLDDASSYISGIVAAEKVTVRKPEKGTEPKLFYVGIEGDLLQPTRLLRDAGYMWADRANVKGGAAEDFSASERRGEFDASVSREVYDVAHATPWGWKIAAYLWTKSIAAGVLLTAAVLLGLGEVSCSNVTGIAAPMIALAMLGITSVLLVFDLKRPERFFYLLTKSNFGSWLVIGAWILIAYGALAAWWMVTAYRFHELPAALSWLTAAFAIAAACYSAFLFAQARGRDLWQSPIFFWHLLAEAMVTGSGALLLTGEIAREHAGLIAGCRATLMISLAAALAMAVVEISLPHASEDGRRAICALTSGRWRWQFWGLAVGMGMILPILLLAFDAGANAMEVSAAALALGGSWIFEALWVKAGQSVPLS